jgi:hypothetical protein
MAASCTSSIWMNSKVGVVNWDWQADSGGLCNSLGMVSGVHGRVKGARIQTYNVASGYGPFSGCGLRVFDDLGTDILRSTCISLVGSSNTLTRIVPESSLDWWLAGDTLRLAVSSAGDNRVGRLQLLLDR